MAVEFIEMLPDSKGTVHKLAGFQKFIISSIYGWVRKDDHSLRRYHKVFISMARKQGKTLLIAGIILYELLWGKNPKAGRQIFCTANDKEQAKIAFKMAENQLKYLRAKYPEMKRKTKIIQNNLQNLDDNSYVKPLSRETGAFDGYEPYLGVLDEYGASKTTEMMELLESGQAQLENPLIVIISTANFNMNAPMYTIEYPRAKQILNEEIEDDSYFAFIAEQESVEEIDDKTTWIKSNPLLEVKGQQKQLNEYLDQRWKVASQTGQKNEVLVKNFNMWRQAGEDSYLDIETWDAAQIDEPVDITGKRVWIGVDAGKTSDLFSISWMIPMEGYWYLDNHSFVGTKYGLDAKIKSDKMDYRKLEEMGQVDITKSELGIIDFEETYEWIDHFVSENNLDVQGICYDPAGFGLLLSMISKYHPEWPMYSIRQGTITLSEPTKQFRDDLIAKKIKHTDNTVLRSAAMNAVTKVDNNGMRIDKNKYAEKIDALDAALDAYTICFTENIDAYVNDDYVMSEDFGF